MYLKSRQVFKNRKNLEEDKPSPSEMSSENGQRRKLDGFPLMDTVDKFLQREEHLCSESNCGLRKSLAWDSAFFTSPGVLDPEELFETLNFRDVENKNMFHGHGEQKLQQHSELSESEKTSRIGECSMRRSLAWDSAFFTSEGVLNPEELSMVNNGLRKSEIHLLPGIEEDIWRSAESNSTVDTDFSLASLEIDLFENLRASFLSNAAPSNAKEERRSGMRKTSKRLEASFRTRIKPAAISRKQNTETPGSERMVKHASIPPKGQHAVRGGGSSPLSSLKPPKKGVRSNPLSSSSTKKSASGPDSVKLETKAPKAASGHQMTVSKKSCFGNSCSVKPSTTPPPKSPFSASHTVTDGSIEFGRASSNLTGKSPLESPKRKYEFRLVASGSTSRSPLRYSAGNRSVVNSGCQTHSVSIKKSYHTSPSSSIDELSLESSTSVNQKSKISATSLHSIPSKVCDSYAPQGLNAESHHRSCFGHDCQKTKSQNHPANISRNFKPSSLRVPSPKLGYFDAENSMVLKPHRGLQFHSGVQSTEIGSCSSNFNEADRTRNDKLRSSTTSSKTGNQKLGSEQAEGAYLSSGIARIRTAQFEVENGSTEASTFSDRKRVCVDRAHNKLSHKFRSEEECFKTVQPGMVKAPVCVEDKVQTLEEHENKENINDFENQVDILSRRIGGIGLSRDLLVEL